ncbi:MAG: hypothetical protein JWO06_1372 [Bacteroidota bacterium]|nr:hypothetical protein [Bacteroidota bacterium]
MRLGLFITFFLTLVAHVSFAQSILHKQWDKRYGGTGTDAFIVLSKTPDNGYILGGASISDTSGDKTQPNRDPTLYYPDSWIIKIDSIGNKEWDKRFGGTGAENAVQLSPTFDGGYIFGGLTTSNVSFDVSQSGRGDNDYWLVKITAEGVKEWEKRFGGVGEDDLTIVKQTRDSGYIIGGFSWSPVSGDKSEPNRDLTGISYDYWVVKTDAQGNKIWDKTLGGTKNEFLNGIEQTSDGGYLVAGTTSSDSGGDKTQNNWRSGYENYWIVKLDSAGNKIWDQRYGGTKGEDLFCMTKTKDGNFLLGGYSFSDISGDKTQNNKGQNDYWILKIDSAGNKIWDRDFGATSSDMLYDVSNTADGGFLLAGNSTSTYANGDKSEDNLGNPQAWIIKTDSAGNKEWDKTILIDSGAYNIKAIQSNDGCFVVGNSTKASIAGYKTQSSWGGEDYWIMKFCIDTVTDITHLTQAPQLSIYPNPFTSDLNIILQKENLHGATFTITNPLGQIIYTQQETNLSPSYIKMLDLSYLPNGVYFVSVVVDGERIVREVVKE